MPNPNNIVRALKELAAASNEAITTLDRTPPDGVDPAVFEEESDTMYELHYKTLIRNVVEKIKDFDRAIGRMP